MLKPIDTLCRRKVRTSQPLEHAPETVDLLREAGPLLETRTEHHDHRLPHRRFPLAIFLFPEPGTPFEKIDIGFTGKKIVKDVGAGSRRNETNHGCDFAHLPLLVCSFNPLVLSTPRRVHEHNVPAPIIPETVVSTADVEVVNWANKALFVPARVEIDLSEALLEGVDEFRRREAIVTFLEIIPDHRFIDRLRCLRAQTGRRCVIRACGGQIFDRLFMSTGDNAASSL